MRQIIGRDHNGVQYSVKKLSMGHVALRIWTKIQQGDATGGTTKGRWARPENNNYVQHTARLKDLPTLLPLFPNVYVCRFSVCPIQNTVWKNWRPLVPLLHPSNGSVVEYIVIFEKHSGEGVAAFLVPFFMYFACDGGCSAQISCEPIYCLAVINPYTLRPLTGLHGDQIDEVLLYMAREDAKARLLKRHRLWEMMYLQPENTMVRPSQHMLLSYPTLWRLWFDNPLPARRTHYFFGAWGTGGPLSS